MMNQELNFFEKMNGWMKNSIGLKLITVGVLILILLIPSFMVRSIIDEREALNHQTISDVSSKWANGQLLKGPILTVPIVLKVVDSEGKVKLMNDEFHFLPEELNVNGEVVPNKLKRGIYEVVVYKSKLDVSGTFDLEEKIEADNLDNILWEKAFLTMGISDLRGIEEEIRVKWNNNKLPVKPGSKIPEIIFSGVTVNLGQVLDTTSGVCAFAFDLNLQGSKELSFAPVGSTTHINLKSPWTSPSFGGAFLPDKREISNDGFTANWKILQLNRNFPQHWIGDKNGSKIENTAFGVNLILPLDDYQKSTRSAKYAVMTIALTFLIFFLVEVLNRRKIHPFQYALVGFALCLFYVLLVSISEHTHFNFAYSVATIAIVLMISLYSVSVFKAKKLTVLLLTTLSGIYGFLFVTLQLADYALLMGSIGLTLILALTMYFTRNINWYKINNQSA